MKSSRKMILMNGSILTLLLSATFLVGQNESVVPQDTPNVAPSNRQEMPVDQLLDSNYSISPDRNWFWVKGQWNGNSLNSSFSLFNLSERTPYNIILDLPSQPDGSPTKNTKVVWEEDSSFLYVLVDHEACFGLPLPPEDTQVFLQFLKSCERAKSIDSNQDKAASRRPSVVEVKPLFTPFAKMVYLSDISTSEANRTKRAIALNQLTVSYSHDSNAEETYGIKWLPIGYDATSYAKRILNFNAGGTMRLPAGNRTPEWKDEHGKAISFTDLKNLPSYRLLFPQFHSDIDSISTGDTWSVFLPPIALDTTDYYEQLLRGVSPREMELPGDLLDFRVDYSLGQRQKFASWDCIEISFSSSVDNTLSISGIALFAPSIGQSVVTQYTAEGIRTEDDREVPFKYETREELVDVEFHEE